MSQRNLFLYEQGSRMLMIDIYHINKTELMFSKEVDIVNIPTTTKVANICYSCTIRWLTLNVKGIGTFHFKEHVSEFYFPLPATFKSAYSIS